MCKTGDTVLCSTSSLSLRPGGEGRYVVGGRAAKSVARLQGNMAKAQAREQASTLRVLAAAWAEQVFKVSHNLTVEAVTAPPGLTPGL